VTLTGACERLPASPRATACCAAVATDWWALALMSRGRSIRWAFPAGEGGNPTPVAHAPLRGGIGHHGAQLAGPGEHGPLPRRASAPVQYRVGQLADRMQVARVL
jgi:hypothetical protein